MKQRISLAVLLFPGLLLPAQTCLCLAYEAFDYPAAVPLDGGDGGTGWRSVAQLVSWGYKDKKFLFYAFKTRPNRSYVAVNRWINALPQGNTCRDYTLSVLETEFTDAQLTSWGYSGKKVQFYVLQP